MGENKAKGMLYLTFVIFILCAYVISFYSEAQCGDCDDENPCTKDYCNGTQCLHEPVACDYVHQSGKESFTGDGTIDMGEIPDDSNLSAKAPLSISESIPEHANCDESNPCTMDYYGANGCVHEPINCDDGNQCTIDSCGISGCAHEPLNCDDGNASTIDSCTPTGCINSPLNSYNAKTSIIELCKTCLSETQANSGDSITNESQNNNSNSENVSIYKNCDDGNACTIDTYDGTGCVHEPLNCDDGNSSTIDSCKAGICVNEPISSTEENNGTIGALEAKLSMQPPSCDDGDQCTIDSYNGTGCEHKQKNCDDGNASTFDYCYEGTCIHTQENCDDGDQCTIDSYNGTECVHKPMNCDDANACTVDYCDSGICLHKPKVCDDGKICTIDSCDPTKGCKSTMMNCNDGNACTIDACDSHGNCVHTLRNCDDGNPCTIDECDSYWGCVHISIVCRAGEVCVNGVCQAISNPLVAPNSYIIPSGSSIVLPWGAEVTAIGPARVENGIAYPAGQPIIFSRQMGYNQAPSIAQGNSENAASAEIVGLSWQGSPLGMTLIKPDGSAILLDSDSQNIRHETGATYDYYFLKDPAKGEWKIEIMPINPGIRGEAFSLITGFVAGTA